MKRRISALALAALGIGAAVAAGADRSPQPAPVDEAALNSYLAELAGTAPPRPGAAIPKTDPAREKVPSAVAKLDRAEPMVASAFGVIG